MASPDGSRSPELGKPISERDRKAEKAAKAERKAERQRHKLAKAERKAAAAGPAPEGTRDGEQERVEPDKVPLASPALPLPHPLLFPHPTTYPYTNPLYIACATYQWTVHGPHFLCATCAACAPVLVAQKCIHVATSQI